MSLDIYLKSLVTTKEEVRCDCCGHVSIEEFQENYFHANITHNLAEMADKFPDGYKLLWRPEELGIKIAGDMVGKLGLMLDNMKRYPDEYKASTPTNGWGNYEGLLQFVDRYLQACLEYPEAIIEVSR